MMGPLCAQQPVYVLLGATASGKTAVAIEVARRTNGEVISADSRAFFVGLNIVTDKPTASEMGGVPHHLIDCVPIDGQYDAMTFRTDVERLLPEIRARGAQPIIAGGGTLYLGAILRGLFEGPAKDERVRAALKARERNDLYHELSAVDPVSAARIHPNDRLRIMRALEVFQLTGQPMSHWREEAKPLSESFRVVGLTREREAHRALIRQRVQRMVADGVIEEIAALRSAGLTPQVQAFRTIGVPEAFRVLDGDLTADEFVDIVSHRTWQLVRRQMTWFRRDAAVQWVDGTHLSAVEVADRLLSMDWDQKTVNEDMA